MPPRFRSSIRLEIVALLAMVVPAGAADPPSAAPLRHAHAHNDLHERPLLDALEHGFASVEADVYLVDGQLLVGHTRAELKPDDLINTDDLVGLERFLRRQRSGD